MKTLKYFFIFLIINFAALGIGVLLMKNGPQTEWYLQLNKAPWTPPGWVFAAAWNSIMLCFSIYMAYLYKLLPNTKVKTLFTIQFILNVGWNYVFFNQHLITLGLIVILLLTANISVFLYDFKKLLSYKTLFILPYFLWLCIATSLNLYILLYN
ncbi:TspO/MBR family protein [Mariniflexile gromovii]|uniref:Tryptophan-rich sensory protein n=1 Tax=Mariniflexile gromovii TaxID=362523 RepID=A0ABS4BU45_9FLAO|nr:TspO/MBR family protein [Mariniflexile gromovii]MBP0904114.1 tryptophan-rich sensory protein [Mariniflexile gromovii]